MLTIQNEEETWVKDLRVSKEVRDELESLDGFDPAYVHVDTLKTTLLGVMKS